MLLSGDDRNSNINQPESLTEESKDNNDFGQLRVDADNEQHTEVVKNETPISKNFRL